MQSIVTGIATASGLVVGPVVLAGVAIEDADTMAEESVVAVALSVPDAADGQLVVEKRAFHDARAKVKLGDIYASPLSDFIRMKKAS